VMGQREQAKPVAWPGSSGLDQAKTWADAAPKRLTNGGALGLQGSQSTGFAVSLIHEARTGCSAHSTASSVTHPLPTAFSVD
jgi:hypothetical protein